MERLRTEHETVQREQMLKTQVEGLSSELRPPLRRSVTPKVRPRRGHGSDPATAVRRFSALPKRWRWLPGAAEKPRDR